MPNRLPDNSFPKSELPVFEGLAVLDLNSVFIVLEIYISKPTSNIAIASSVGSR